MKNNGRTARITRTEAGSGGRKGHSNMAHFDGTAIVKKMSRKARRTNDRILARNEGDNS